MNKSFAQRFLELLPPKLLSEVVDFCVSNGSVATTIVKAGKERNGLPTAFWPLDAYQNEEARHNALTAMAIYVSIMDAQVTYGEDLDENYWMIMSALRFGSSQDVIFKKEIARDEIFDGDEDEDNADEFLTKEQMQALEASPGYKAASKHARKALLTNVDFLTELRSYGKAVGEMIERSSERNYLIGNFQSGAAARSTMFSGDVDAANDADALRMLVGDVLKGTVVSSSDAFVGGWFKKLAKKIGGGLKGALKFIPGMQGVSTLVSMAGSLKKKKRPPQPAPQYEPEYAPEPEREQDSMDADCISLRTPEGRVLFGLAKAALAQADKGGRNRGGRPGYGSGYGDIIAPDSNNGVMAVDMPAIITPQGDVYGMVGDTLVPMGFDGDIANDLANLANKKAECDAALARMSQTINRLSAEGYTDQEILNAGDDGVAFKGDLKDIVDLISAGRGLYNDIKGPAAPPANEGISPRGRNPNPRARRKRRDGSVQTERERAATDRLIESQLGGRGNRLVNYDTSDSDVSNLGSDNSNTSGVSYKDIWKSMKARIFNSRSTKWRSAHTRVARKWDSSPASARVKAFGWLGDVSDVPPADGLND